MRTRQHGHVFGSAGGVGVGAVCVGSAALRTINGLGVRGVRRRATGPDAVALTVRE